MVCGMTAVLEYSISISQQVGYFIKVISVMSLSSAHHFRW